MRLLATWAVGGQLGTAAWPGQYNGDWHASASWWDHTESHTSESMNSFLSLPSVRAFKFAYLAST